LARRVCFFYFHCNKRTLNLEGEFSRKFARFEYWSPEREDFMLMHYVGDHTVWVPRPHGNAKKATAQPYVRTQPEVLHAIKMQVCMCMLKYIIRVYV
jgi:hypothetical protein